MTDDELFAIIEADDYGRPSENFHSRVMNIPTDRRRLMDASTEACDRPRVYEYGHRDARHAAAGIASEADQRITELEEWLGKAARLLTECNQIIAEEFPVSTRKLRAEIAAALAAAQQEGK